jgi:hypothetical protein
MISAIWFKAAVRAFDGALAREAQLPDALDDRVGEPGDDRGVPGECPAGGHLSVDRIALAASAARVGVRLVDLDA